MKKKICDNCKEEINGNFYKIKMFELDKSETIIINEYTLKNYCEKCIWKKLNNRKIQRRRYK